MSPQAASDFANDWIRAWNARDLPAILAHYADDCVLHTPLAQWLDPCTQGVLLGSRRWRLIGARPCNARANGSFR